MVPGQGVLQPDLRLVRSPAGRPLCNEGQLPAGEVHLSLSGQVSSRLGRFRPGLEQLEFHLPVPADPDPPRSDQEAELLPRERFPGGSFLGDRLLVSSPHGKVSRVDSPSSEVCSVSVHEPGIALAPQPFSLSADRMEAVKKGLVLRGYSGYALEFMLLRHRVSSQRQYQTCWLKFLEHLGDRSIAHDAITRDVVFNFLALLAKTKKYRTLSVYKCALRHPLLFLINLELDCEEMVFLRCGFFNANSPERRAPSAVWSLDVVLYYLVRGPFEPLESTSWRFLCQKTLILFLLASGRRISDLANLSPSFRWEKDRLFLLWRDGFMSKGLNMDFRPEPPSIAKLAIKGDRGDLLCPVRAWNAFRRKRASPSCLTFKDGFFWPFSQKTLSDMVVSTVQKAHQFSDLETPAKIGPHQFRKFAASYSFKRFCHSPLGESSLAKRMGSRSFSIIKKNYVDPLVPDVKFRCMVPLGTITV